MGQALLDSYFLERQPVFTSTADEFIDKSIHVDRDFLAAFDPAKNRTAFEAERERRRTGAVAEVGAFEQAARALGLTLTILRCRRAGGREKLGAGLILVRLDQFVAWAGKAEPGTVAILL